MKETKEENKKPFVVVRTLSAGVHAGYLESHKKQEVELSDAIRIWYWDGAASLSQFAMEGVKKPENCKFSIPVKKIILIEAIEILFTTTEAEENIRSVPSWKI